MATPMSQGAWGASVWLTGSVDDAVTDAELELWLQGLPRDRGRRDVERMESQLTQKTEAREALDEEITRLSSKLRARRQALSLYEMVLDADTPPVGPQLRVSVARHMTRHFDREGSGLEHRAHVTRPTTRQAILDTIIQDPARAWKLSEIRDAMVDHGWLTQDDPSGAHRVQMVASNMVRRGELVRPEFGYYALSTAGLDG